MRVLASAMVVRRSSSGSPVVPARPSNVATAMPDATSPAREPPMPSATTNSGGRARWASSFDRRIMPVCVAAANSTTPRVMRRPRRRARWHRPTRRRRGAAAARPPSGWPFTKVPLVDPRSSRYGEPSRLNTRAWRPDTVPSASQRHVAVLGPSEHHVGVEQDDGAGREHRARAHEQVAGGGGHRGARRLRDPVEARGADGLRRQDQALRGRADVADREPDDPPHEQVEEYDERDPGDEERLLDHATSGSARTSARQFRG